MFFLAMKSVKRNDMANNTNLFQQFLRRRYLIRFFINLDMGKHQIRSRGKGAEDLFGSNVVESIETAFQCLPVQRQNTPLCHLKFVGIQAGSMLTKHIFHILSIKSDHNSTERGMGGRFLPLQSEGLVECLPVNLDKRAYVPIRIGSRNNR
jgi:hypothetical protein